MTGIREKTWLIIAVFLAACLITGVIFLSTRLSRLQPAEIVLKELSIPPGQGTVVISGAVSRPGIYETRAGDTLSALVSAAGVSDNANLSAMTIYVPLKGETVKPQKADLNRAEAWMLQALPGIGEGKARLIVDYRARNGPFRSIDDLLKIEGFGKSTVDRIRAFVTIGE